MITRADIDDRVRLWGLREDVVEKDYVLGWVLWGIGTDQQLDRSWVFKGGTCLKKYYIETYRFSLRRTRSGDILLHAIRADDGENRTYRIDRIQSVAVTTHPFRPRFVVEFPVAGAIPTPPSRRRSVSRRRRVRRARRRR